MLEYAHVLQRASNVLHIWIFNICCSSLILDFLSHYSNFTKKGKNRKKNPKYSLQLFSSPFYFLIFGLVKAWYSVKKSYFMLQYLKTGFFLSSLSIIFFLAIVKFSDKVLQPMRDPNSITNTHIQDIVNDNWLQFNHP